MRKRSSAKETAATRGKINHYQAKKEVIAEFYFNLIYYLQHGITSDFQKEFTEVLNQ